MGINSAFTEVIITIEHLLKDLDRDYYSIDMKLKCGNSDVQKHLDVAYRNHFYLPYFRKSETLCFNKKIDDLPKQ